ncbi:MAG: hypothetical protein GY838_15520 [bacterium]|nr:hypothetical protein [bacterium]
MDDTQARYDFAVGRTVLGLDCVPAPFAEGLTRWFGAPSANTDAHLDLRCEMVTHEDTPELPNSLLTTKTLTGDGGFDIAGGLITGRYDAGAGRGEIRAKATLLRGRLMRIWEQILYQAYTSARQARGDRSFLIHSSAVIAGGKGFLFVGPSESGKSTAAVNSCHHHVLGDEMSLVEEGEDGLEVVGTLFNGTFKEKRPGRAPLAGVFVLQQADRHALAPMGRAEAVAALSTEIVPPVGLDQVPDDATVPAMFDTAASLLDRTEVLRLELLPDPGFWQPIATHFGLAEAGPNRGN